MAGDEGYLTPAEVSQQIRVGVRTLANWRVEGKGPKWVKLGGKVLYPLSDFIAWKNREPDPPRKYRARSHASAASSDAAKIMDGVPSVPAISLPSKLPPAPGRSMIVAFGALALLAVTVMTHRYRTKNRSYDA